MTGTGTQNDPYIITTAADLQAIEDDLDAYYELGGNVDASATSEWNANAGFLPITNFTGYLDGKTYTISDLTINRGSADDVGLFSIINNTGSYAVKNLTITGDYAGDSGVAGLVAVLTDGLIDSCVSQVNVTGDDNLGGLVSDLHTDGEVTNSSATGTITSDATSAQIRFGGFAAIIYGKATKCYATGSLAINSQGEDRCGGFAGEILGTAVVSECYATGAITGADDEVGGFVGRNYSSTIKNCYARGAVTGDDMVGGFAGRNYYLTLGGTIEDCYSTGVPTGNTNVGGLVGDNGSGTGTVTTCFWDKETSGEATSDGGTGKTTAEMKIHHTYLVASWDFKKIWKIDADVNNAYPSLGQITSIGLRDTWLEGPYFCYYDDYGNKRKVEGLPVASGLPWWYFT